MVSARNSTFANKADRYLSAMQHCRQARLPELAPVCGLLPSRRDNLLDLFGGSGFVSDYIGKYFKQVVLVDQTGEMLPPPFPGQKVIRGDGLNERTFDGLRNFDAVICLAGFHHLLPVEGDISASGFDSLRKQALRSWFHLLSPGGRLIIGDVSAPFSAITQTSLSTKEKSFLLREGGLDETALRVLKASPRFGEGKPEPALFFDHFVKRESPLGHEAAYEDGESLCNLLRSSGFMNVGYQLRFTPWLFSDIATAVWFLHELFAIGQTACESPGQLSERQIGLVKQAMEKYLGYEVLSDGRCVVHWKLLYAWGDKDVA